MDALLPVVATLGFFPVFILFWCGVVYLIGGVGGWRRAAEAYPEMREESGESFYLQGARFGLSNYKGVLNLRLSPNGVTFSVMPLFRIGHPPFFVPWEDITAKEETAWFRNIVKVNLARVPGLDIQLYGTAGPALLKSATAGLFG